MAKTQQTNNDRMTAIRLITEAVKKYKAELVGKSFMYVFDDDYIEVLYNERNFKHLTGVHSDLPAKQFFDLAVKGHLRPEQIGFTETHPFQLAMKKLGHINNLTELATSSRFILEGVATETKGYDFALTDGVFSVLFAPDECNRHSGTFVATSLRDRDCLSKSRDVYRTDYILSRSTRTGKYDAVLYESEKTKGLPDCVKDKLNRPLQEEFFAEIER